MKKLLWKRIEASYHQDRFDIAEAWCQLCLHSIFGDTGVLNTGKVQRFDSSGLFISCLPERFLES